MKNQNLRRSASAVAILTALGALVGTQVANAGPGIAPVYSATAAPPPAAPDTFASTYFANSPLGPRVDLVANPTTPANPAGPFIDTGAALRKFVDVLPGIQGLAPTTNTGTGTIGVNNAPKYIPLAVATKWPSDNSDYYHIAIVEYTEQMHSDLPKGTTLRGYVQIEEPGLASAPAGSKHIQLFYPNGTAITLPDANGVQHPVYGYDNPHYLGPAIAATKDVATRIKYSNLLPVGDATGIDPWGNALGNGVANRNGDLPIPVDATIPGGALPQNRVAIHMHGGLTPWISDGTPHQWTMAVGDNRYSFLSDIAVTAVGAGYVAPTVTIDPPQAIATGHAKINTTTGLVTDVVVDNPGGLYASVPNVTFSTPPLFKSAVQAVATASVGAGKVTAVADTTTGTGYLSTATATVSAPTPSVNATGTATLTGSGVSAIAANVGNIGYATAPAVTVAAPAAAVAATAVLTATNGVLSLANNANFGYWTAPAAPTLAAPQAAAQASGTANLSGNAVAGINSTNAGFGYWSAPAVTLSAPAAAVQAVATASVTAATGGVSRITNATAGFGYWTAPNVTLSAPSATTQAAATASVNATTGAVTGIANTTGGYGYWAAPAVTLSAPPATSQATATATLNATGGVASVAVAAGNFGYWTNPTITVSAPGVVQNTTATASATVSGTTGAVSAVSGVVAGTGYTTAPTVSVSAPPVAANAIAAATLTGTSVGAIANTNAPVGYWTAPTVTLSAPTTTQAVASAALSGSSVGSIALSNAGWGYATAPTVTLSAPPAAVNATGTATVAGGVVTGVAVNATNLGYYTAPTVTLSAPPAGGTTAVIGRATVNGALGTATATVTTGKVVTLSKAGVGYTAAPRVTIAGGTRTSGTAWTATATVAGGVVTGVTVTGTGVYSVAPTITIAAPTGISAANANVTVTTPGAGYAAAPVLTVTGGTLVSGTAWTATATVNGTGAVSGVTLSGTGIYSRAPTITAAAPPAGVTATATATVANGRITGITITNAGTGYTTAPRVTIGAATAGIPATATATVAGNLITGFTITNAGQGYAAAPTVTLGAPVVGTQATATATVAGGTITGYTIVNAGSGYQTAPTVTVGAAAASRQAVVTATLGTGAAAGTITGYTVSNAGAGYTSAPTLTVSAPPPTVGVTAVVTPVISAGVLTGLNVTNAGSGYTAAPTVTIGAPVAGTQATANATVANGAVTGYAITNPGTGYATAPTVTLGAPVAGTQATATANVANGAVTGYTITNPGTGYATAPTVTLDVPVAGTQATATANVANGVITGYTVTNGGAGYTAAPTVTIGAPTASVQATVTTAVANGVLTYTLANPGLGYINAPTITAPAPTASVTATATATVAAGVVTGYTVTNAGTNYLAAPAVTVAAAPAAVQATATPTLVASTSPGFYNLTGYSLTNAGYGYWTAPSVVVSAPAQALPATGTAVLDANGAVTGIKLTSYGSGYSSAPTVTIDPPKDAAGRVAAIQATATATASGGSLTGVTLTNIGRGYLKTPNVTVADSKGTGGTINALIAVPVGSAFHQVPDMTGNDTSNGSVYPLGYVAPIVGEGTSYYTNNQTERLMWYHDHASGVTRLNAYNGMAAPYLLMDPRVDPPLPGSAPVVAAGSAPSTTGVLDSYVPREQIALVVQDKTFVPKDIMQQDANWDTTHWGTYGDLWYPHVYETNQNPAFLRSLSNLGRWDWGPWFAIVYPALYSLPSGKYGDVTLTPEAYEDTAVVNGVAYPTMQVEPRAYRFRVLNGSNDRFLNMGFYLADMNQPAAFADPLHAAGTNYTEVAQFAAVSGVQPTAATVSYTDQYGAAKADAVAPNVFQNPSNAALLPWPTDGGAAGAGYTHIVPAPSTMGPPAISIGNEAGILPRWVQHDPVPINFDYNRRSVTVLNTSQNNDVTQVCYPECHGLYLGPAERADVVVDFAPYAGKTLILYNDAPAPNPGEDGRIDYYTGNDPSGAINYATGGAPNTVAGYGPSTRTLMQVTVGTTQNVSGTNPIDYTNASQAMPAAFASWNPAAAGLTAWNPNALGAGAVLGTLTTQTPGLIQKVYAGTQPVPLVGESAYNIAFNPTTAADPMTIALGGSAGNTGGYVDEYGNMYLGSQNQPEFYVTNPGPLTITGFAVTGNTTATGAASGVGLGAASTGTNAGAGSGTSYTVPPQIIVSPPTSCVVNTTTCVAATATATVSGGQVTAVNLVQPGAGYTEVPSVTIVSAGGTVNAVSVTNGGSGYTVAPTVTLSAPPAAAGAATATATANLGANGNVIGFTITSPGAGYTVAPTVTIAAPASIAAVGSSVLASGAVASVNVTSAGTYPVGTVPTVSFSAAPQGVAATLAPVITTVATVPPVSFVTGWSITNGGAGYTPNSTFSVTDSACGGSGTASVNASGAVTGVLLTGLGAGNCSVVDTIALGATPTSGTTATGTAVMDATGTMVTGVTLSNPGAGYAAAPAVTFTGGAQATANAAVTGGGYGATAIAIASTTKVFISPSAIPGNIVPPTPGAVPVTLTPSVAALLGCNAAQTSCTNLSGAVVGRLQNPAIQELFEPFYGRMNATLGIEMPNQSLTVQTTLPLNYVDPGTEMWEDGKPVMWKITHNGVDAHPVHIHLINAQVLNRVGWDGTIKVPEDDEIGWKETIKMNPLEDIVLAIQPALPKVPFGLERSIRAQDSAAPLGVNLGFTQFSVEGFSGGINGQTVMGQTKGSVAGSTYDPVQFDSAWFGRAGGADGGIYGHTSMHAGYITRAALGVGDPATVVNSMENYDNEYVWHCHILGHEENDFMRPISVLSSPLVPGVATAVAAAQAGAGQVVSVTWVDPTPAAPLGTVGNSTFGNAANELGFLLQRSSDAGVTWSTVGSAPANGTTATDVAPLTGTSVVYRVVGYNVAGRTASGASAAFTAQ